MNLLKRLLTISLFLTASVQAQESRTYFVSDVVGSPIMATDEYANLRWSEEYLPFGERTKYSVNTANNGRWFTSAPQNIDSGLIDLGNRQYDPIIGRFMGIDPVNVTADAVFSFNKYAYANNNPYKYIDPDGREPYLASRPLDGTKFANHNFIVTDANFLADPNAKVFSYGDRGDDTLGRVDQNTTGFSITTHATDKQA